jgi:sortase (surface protein transpeptidase)
VLAAHVDYDGRRGAFFRLRELEPGATVSVAYDDGSTRTFTVSTRRSYDKDALPTDELFTREGPAILTLVTCGGPFDAAARSYLENVVVQAVPVG